MKNKIHKTITLAICTLAFSFAVQGQLPNFIKIDTGAISQLWGGHISSTCLDMDNDGDQDLFVGNSGVFISRTFSFFKNERNGFFEEMPEFTSVKIVSAFGDIENDGDIDLMIGLNTNEPTIYTNNGNGVYEFHDSVYLWFGTVYPTFLDLNNDGFLDVLGIHREGSVVYNDGNGGFPTASGLGFFTQQDNVHLHGVSWGDLDDDGDLDFYGGYSPSNENGISINTCYLNDGNGWFTEFNPASPIVEDTCITTCANWLDYDNDGDMDLYVHNVGCEGSLSALYENLGNLQFTKHDFIDEIYRYSWANSGVWGDLDNDADLDLFISVENNPFPFPAFYGDTSATPYNIIYLNEGNGQFTNILDHPLTLEDSHTALLFDHDNDGDLDVLLTRYSWSNDGYNNLFVNEGNDNSWINLTCEGTTSNRSAIGTRVQAKAFVNGAHITQTREITPINGHLSWANLRVHFGLGDAGVIDTLVIRWPSGQVDEYLNVEANQFYRAIENDELRIDFKATNYIQYKPHITVEPFGEIITIDLKEHYTFIEGDTVPQFTGDTIQFSVYNNGNPGVVLAEIDGSILTLTPLANGQTTIEILASSLFAEPLDSTERVDAFGIDIITYLTERNLSNHLIIDLYPNPAHQDISISVEGFVIDKLSIYTLTGQQVLQERPVNGTIDISDLQPGMYIVEVTIENTRIRQKLLIQR